jgi:small-conductance mechanosensitive channel
VSHLNRASANTGVGVRTHLARSFIALAIAALAIAASATAQEAPATEEPASPPEDLAIPLVEVSQRAEQTALVLSKAAATFPQTPDVAEIEEQIDETERSLAMRRRLLERNLESGGHRGRLSDISTEWEQTLSQLDGWRKTLAPKLLKVESAIESLMKEQRVWERTREKAKGADSPETITKRINTTLSELNDAIATARERQSSLLTLQDRIVQQDLLATASRDRIRTAQRESRSDLLERDAPALWRDLFGVQPSDHIDDTRTSIAEDLRKLREFAATSGSRFLLDLLIFIVVIRYAFAVKRRLENPIEGLPAIGRSGELFQRPVAIALLATILLARLVHGPAPVGFTTLFILGLLVPLVRLVPLLLPPQMRWVVWAIAALLVLSRARLIVHDAPLAGEFLFILEAVGMVAILLWLMRPARLQEMSASTHVPRLLASGMRATLVLLSLAIFSSALGFRSFGLLVGSATLTSVYAAIILYAAARAAEAAMEASFHTAPARKLSFVRRRRDAVLGVTGRYASALAMIYWGYLALRNFELLEPAREAMHSILDASLGVGEIEISLRDMFAFVLTIALAFLLSRLIRFFLEEEAFPRMQLRRGVGNAIATLLQYTLLLLGFALALSAAGMDFTRVALFAGAFSVGIGFGLQTVVNNFVSGLILLFERPIQIGDMVEVGTLRGEVRRIGARSSTVRTFDGAEVIVPNANLITEPVVNWTLSDRRRRLDLEVGVAYGTDPEVVLELLHGVAGAHPAVLETPNAEALFLEFGDSSLNFRLRVWIPRFEESFAIRSQLSVAINAALRDAGIQIPFPQRDLHVRSVESDVIRSLDDRTRE